MTLKNKRDDATLTAASNLIDELSGASHLQDLETLLLERFNPESFAIKQSQEKQKQQNWRSFQEIARALMLSMWYFVYNINVQDPIYHSTISDPFYVKANQGEAIRHAGYGVGAAFSLWSLVLSAQKLRYLIQTSKERELDPYERADFYCTALEAFSISLGNGLYFPFAFSDKTVKLFEVGAEASFTLAGSIFIFLSVVSLVTAMWRSKLAARRYHKAKEERNKQLKSISGNMDNFLDKNRSLRKLLITEILEKGGELGLKNFKEKKEFKRLDIFQQVEFLERIDTIEKSSTKDKAKLVAVERKYQEQRYSYQMHKMDVAYCAAALCMTMVFALAPPALGFIIAAMLTAMLAKLTLNFYMKNKQRKVEKKLLVAYSKINRKNSDQTRKNNVWGNSKGQGKDSGTEGSMPPRKSSFDRKAS